jgi:hypothetical protein
MTVVETRSEQGKGFKWIEGFEESRQALNRRPFRLTHAFANHPLFQMDRLIEQARLAAKRPGDLYFDSGDVTVDQKWGKIPLGELSYDEVLHRIEHAKAWLIMKHIEQDPAYGEVLDACTRSLMELAPEPMRSNISKPEMLIIVSSPGRITPFHIDGELNFLVQIQGSKTARIFDRENRAVLTEEEIERFYTVDGVAANFKEGIEDHAQVFELAPGEAVHIPVNCPHWVRNGNGVSVSLSINYELPESWRANLYRANYFLRKVGIVPATPGQSPFSDRMKNLAITCSYVPARRVAEKVRNLVRKKPA